MCKQNRIESNIKKILLIFITLLFLGCEKGSWPELIDTETFYNNNL